MKTEKQLDMLERHWGFNYKACFIYSPVLVMIYTSYWYHTKYPNNQLPGIFILIMMAYGYYKYLEYDLHIRTRGK